MFKKIFGGLFFAAAITALIGSIANGNLFKASGSAAVMLGAFIGTLFPICLYIFSGIFMFTMDSAKKLSRAEGFEKRGKQSKTIIIFMVIYGVLMLLSMFAGFNSYAIYLEFSKFFLTVLLMVLPYFVPFMFFTLLFQMYALPHSASKKHFLTSKEKIDEYLSCDYNSITNDNSILANDKALFFPDLLCVVPFDQIASTKLLKQLWEQDVYFNLKNGKKFYVLSRQYESIQKAIAAYNEANQ